MIDICGICTVFLGSSKRTKIVEITELIEALFVQLNLKVREEFICDACLIKIQSACTFKAAYLEISQKLCIKQEDIENEVVCEICKKIVSPIDCIPLFYSVTEFDKLNLFKYLSADLQLKSQDSPQTCDLCHNSILNFCMVIKSFSAFVQHKFSNETINDFNSEKSNSDQVINVNNVDSTDGCRMNIKEEQVPTTTYEDFLCKNEEIDLKTEDEPFWSHSHQEVEVIKCSFCDYQTSKASCLKIHMLTHKNSNGIKLFKCQICDYQTKYKHHLKNHLIVHKNSNEVEIFRCNICDYQTKYKHHLKNHIIVHKNSNEIEMFKCQVCDYQTRYKCDLKKHLIVHKNSNEVEIFKCQICDYQTKYKHHFKRHLIVHKNWNIKIFRCDICDYQTKYKHYLKRHIFVHKNFSEIEIFKCEICGFQTKHKWTLKNHIIAHKNRNEVDMFICPICDYQTKYKSYLKKHTVSHII